MPVKKIQNTEPEQHQSAETVIKVVEDDKKKRRGRKPKDKFAFDDTIQEKPDQLSEPDINTVIKIPISCMELDKEFNTMDSIMPMPFDKSTSDNSYKYISDIDNFNRNDTNNIDNFANNFMTTQSAVYLDYYQNKVNDILSDVIEPPNKKQLTQVEILLEKKYKHTKQPH